MYTLSTYVMSDIHGCYKEFLSMLDKINFSDSDYLFITGDYIDRGKQSYEMLKWIEHCPSNIRLIRGNHDEEFAAYVDLMFQLDRNKSLKSNFASNKDTTVLYESVKYILKNNDFFGAYFDLYGTIGDLLHTCGVTMDDLCRWEKIIRKMPYYCELQVGNRPCIVVHAGYAETLEDIGTSFSSLEEFYLCARTESYQLGGKRHGMVISGHTPTIAKGTFAYNRGKVFRYYDEEKDCVFYYIDCGCVFRSRYWYAKLACIRLEDKKIFYV